MLELVFTELFQGMSLDYLITLRDAHYAIKSCEKPDLIVETINRELDSRK